MRRLGCILLVIAALAPGGSATASATGLWVPAQGLRWQYQLQGKLNTTLCTIPATGGGCVRPNVYDVDLYARDGIMINTAGVAQIHANDAVAGGLQRVNGGSANAGGRAGNEGSGHGFSHLVDVSAKQDSVHPTTLAAVRQHENARWLQSLAGAILLAP